MDRVWVGVSFGLGLELGCNYRRTNEPSEQRPVWDRSTRPETSTFETETLARWHISFETRRWHVSKRDWDYIADLVFNSHHNFNAASYNAANMQTVKIQIIASLVFVGLAWSSCYAGVTTNQAIAYIDNEGVAIFFCTKYEQSIHNSCFNLYITLEC